MLNRRLIRIRAMQALYAYKQSEKANYLLAQESIKEHYAPDLNSMEKQDKQKLEGYTRLSINALNDLFNSKDTDDELPADVLRQAKEAFSSLRNANRKDFEQLTLNTLREADKVYEVYYILLSLYVSVAKLAAADKTKEGKRSIADNKLLKDLIANTTFEVASLKTGFDWANHQDFVKELYKTVIKKNDKYIAYCEKLNQPLEEELTILKYMAKNIFLKNEVSNGFFERYHLYWTEDKDTLRAMLSHTFQSVIDDGQITVFTPDETWQERKDFLMVLYKRSIRDADELLEYIDPKLKNWEMDRIADLDKILLSMALVEMMEFPSIPVKVTINEIVEIAKNYSTPKSSQFINGVLDNLSKELTESGKIKKSGRGMLDNK